MPREIELPAARLAATGPVGDLDVGHPVGVPVDGGIQIVSVIRQMEKVAEESGVVDRKPIEYGDHVVRGAQRVGLGSADRLHQQRRVVRGDRPGRPGQVLGRQLVLFFGAYAFHPVAVERIVGTHPEGGPDADDHVEIVQELR